jgi:hypothetical protein
MEGILDRQDKLKGTVTTWISGSDSSQSFMGDYFQKSYRNNPRNLQLVINAENSTAIIMVGTLMFKTSLRGLICVFKTMEVTMWNMRFPRQWL